MKAYLLARVSSKEQEDNNSIPAQTRRLQEYAERNNFELAEIYQLVESSTKANRRKFHELIAVISDTKSTVALVVDTVDRLQRDFRESVILDDLRRTGKLELHFIRERLIINDKSNSSEILQWDMAVMFAKSYVTQLSDNVKRSFEQKKLNGEWAHRAPLGYKNVTQPDGRKWIEVDPLTAPSVRSVFEWYGAGTNSLLTVKRKLRAQYGLQLSKSQLDRLLKNRFYVGEMVIKTEIHPHRYKRIINPELFEAAQAVREGFKINPKRWGGLPYPYRGLISCATCGCRVTFEKKKQKYVYGHCTQYKGKHKATYVSEDKLTEQLRSVFENMSIPQNAYIQVSKALQSKHREATRNIEQNKSIVEAEIKKYQNRIDSTFEAFIDKAIDEEIYKRKTAEYKESKLALEKQLATFELGIDKKYASVSHLLEISRKAPESFKTANFEQKRSLINFVLSNLELNGEKLRWEYKKPFDKMAFCKENGNWLGRRDSNPRMPGPKPGALPLGHSPSLRYQHTESAPSYKVRPKRFTDEE